MSWLSSIFSTDKHRENFREQLKNVLGFKPGNVELYLTALSHRSVKETAEENNERLEYLGDAILSAVVADYLFMRYPKKGEGFLTEMRSKMVNRQMLNDIALKMGVKKITQFNKIDSALKNSQIFGNTLEALVGAIYLDKGYKQTLRWVTKRIILPHLLLDDLELQDINIKNKLIGWANKQSRSIDFETLEEKQERGRRLFIVGVKLDGEVIAAGRGFNKKDASQMAALQAVEKLGL
ncbi:ribonuclease III [Phnomibacter ginsenosidimutans]|uniref:Ribonuclease 3 n=1 Tax=Phnomibacter ginsenosidimutans TaxID=2676868 RepID=A0A6I6GNJ3_9BACT|nr:ribonuclease III [Phnomibacter ginsenosidimutans]QGW29248.1 ribonuclease III [Phnomibacter ginsenosidimutans]